MRNLKHVFVLSLFTSLSFMSIGQVTILPVEKFQYGENEKLHARGLAADKKKLYVAASDGKLYILDPKNRAYKDLDYSVNAELRDVEVTRKQIVLLASGDSSATVSINKKDDKYVVTKYPGLFLDGISIVKKSMFMMGDPIENAFMLFRSDDAGNSWKLTDSLAGAIKGEAGFAASGTNAQMTSKKDFYFVSGGMDSRLYRSSDAGTSWSDFNMGFKPCNSCGAYSFVILPDKKTIIAVGGDYTKPEEQIGTCRISNDGGETWHSPSQDLSGYRSNVIYHKRILYACGSNGIDASIDYGETWAPFTLGNYFTMTIFQKQLVASTTNGTLHFFQLTTKK